MTLISPFTPKNTPFAIWNLPFKCEGSVNMYSTGQDMAKGIQ